MRQVLRTTAPTRQLTLVNSGKPHPRCGWEAQARPCPLRRIRRWRLPEPRRPRPTPDVLAYRPADVIRQTVFPTSQAMSSAPDLSIATITGRLRALLSPSKNPVTTSLTIPLGCAVEWHEDDLVSIEALAVPAAVLPDKGAAAIGVVM